MSTNRAVLSFNVPTGKGVVAEERQLRTKWILTNDG